MFTVFTVFLRDSLESAADISNGVHRSDNRAVLCDGRGDHFARPFGVRFSGDRENRRHGRA
jgi:hypothetical protein